MSSSLKPTLPEDRQTVCCLYCQQPNEVSRKAITITCKHCNKALRVEDVLIKTYEARRTVDTCGIITIEKKGNVVADKLNCGGMVVRGKVKATVLSRGPILVGPEAELRGDVTAPSIAVGSGAVLEGKYRIGRE